MARIGVVGGGIVGTLAALLASGKGHSVTLVEQDGHLWSRASGANEGKIHLGPIFALGDEATHRVMLRGAVSFGPLVERAVGHAVDWESLGSEEFRYLVMPDSLVEPHDLVPRYEAINRLAAAMSSHAYLGRPLDRVVDARVVRDEVSGLPSFVTAERSVDPTLLHSIVEHAVADAGVELRLETVATGAVHHRDGVTITTDSGDDVGPFDAVINGAWEKQHLLESRRHRHPLNFRVKIAVRVTSDPSDRAITLVHGPYGDAVRLPTHTYLSWYPVGRVLHESGWEPSAAVDDAVTGIQKRADVVERTLDALRDTGVWSGHGQVIEATGGVIVGHGAMDIDDRASRLHARSEFGATREGRIVTPHNFKLTTAPLAAAQAVDAVGDLS